MQYFRKRNAFLSGSVWPVGLTLFVLVLLFVVLRLFAPQVLVTISSPLWSAGTALAGAAGGALLPFEDVAALSRERDTLAREHAALEAENRTLKAQLSDIATLGALDTRISAGVLAGPPVSPYDMLIVAAGVEADVRPGAIVYGPGGTPLGTVESVAERSAHISLYSAPQRKTAGWIGEARLPLTLEGRGAGAFSASLPRDAAIVVGDTVYLPGPGALPVGTVVRIDTDPSSPRATIHIRPWTSVFSVTWVSIER